MDEVEMAYPECILQCGNLLTEENSTKEHVIPNAIGGRKTVTGFICNSCNNNTGSLWDAELARQLNPLSLLLGIRRYRKSVPSQVFPTSGDGEVQLHSDGRMTIAKPSHEVTTVGSAKQLKISARSMRELRSSIEGLRSKYPSLKDRSIDDLMATAQASSYYSSDMTQITLEFGGEKTGRSLVKSAVALVYGSGIDPKACDLALDYLSNESAKPCFGYHYDGDRDLVVNRPLEKPFHCVYVQGHSDTGAILGYVEFYSLHRMLLCLSESYAGNDFSTVYAIDPIRGEELDIDIDLDLSMSDIRSAFDYERFDDDVRQAAAKSLFEYIVKADLNRALDKAVEGAVKYAFDNCDAKHGEYLTDDQLQHLIKDIMDKMTPFIKHNAERFGN